MSSAVTIALLLLGSARPTAAALSLAPYEPEKGCYIGAYIELDPKVCDDVGVFEALVGKKHATYFRYVGYGRPFPFEWVRKLRDAGYVPHIAWEPNDGLDVVRDDEYLRGWAQAARHAQCPIFLRYASEMNGNWQAWSGNPALYIEKWRMVARVMREIAPNVALVWCPFALPQRNIPEYYPGDEYVDWVGVNIYSVKKHDGDPDKPAGESPVELLRYVYNLYADRKPIAICEYGATHFCAATGERCIDFALKNMRSLYEALPTQFPRVKMINWFSVDAAHSGLAHNDYALTTAPEKLALYRELVASNYFISSVLQQLPPATVVAVGPEAAQRPAEGSSGAAPLTPPGTVLAADGLVEGSVSDIHVAILGAHPTTVSERVEIVAQLPDAYMGYMVTIYVDERVKSISNAPPFSFQLHADVLEPGLHKIRVQVSDVSDRVVAERECGFIVIASE